MPVRRQTTGRFLPVKNERLVEIGLRNMEALVETNQRNAWNAIQATGYPVTIYNPLLNGRPCTCSRIEHALLNDDGNMSEDSMAALLSGADNEIVPYGDGITSQRTISNPQDGTPSYILDYAAPNEDSVRTLRGGTITQVSILGDGDPSAELDQENSEALGTQDVSDLVGERTFTSDSRSCGLCFGTGFVGGYSVLGGTRLILDTTLPHVATGVTVNQLLAPNAFEILQGTATVTWVVVIPRGTQFAIAPKLWNDKESIDRSLYVLQASADGTIWATVDETSIMAYATGLPVSVRITTGTQFSFTHLELMFSNQTVDTLVKADFPEVDRTFDVSFLNSMSTVTIITPGTYMVNRRSVIIDHLPKLGQHWRASSVEPKRDQLGNSYSVVLNSRVMDLYEAAQLLRPLTQGPVLPQF